MANIEGQRVWYSKRVRTQRRGTDNGKLDIDDNDNEYDNSRGHDSGN